MLNAKEFRCLIAPDSFKGSLSAAEAARHLSAGVLRAIPCAQITCLPIADGGEGTAEVIFSILGHTWVHYTVTDANAQARQIPVALCQAPHIGHFAVFDVAHIIGLPHATIEPAQRTTKGVGELIAQLIETRVTQAPHHKLDAIVIGLGGSSTMDAGAGMLSALAYDFYDHSGRMIAPSFGNLNQITRLKAKADWHKKWHKNRHKNEHQNMPRLIALTDVTCPLSGHNGASLTFGAQKGFTDLLEADHTLAAFAQLFETELHKVLNDTNTDSSKDSIKDSSQNYANLCGAGAAGGLGFGLACLGAQLESGASFIFTVMNLHSQIAQYDWVITGEGRSDQQTVMGKGPAMIAALAKKNGVPVTLISGSIEHCASLDAAFDGCFSITSGPLSLREAMEQSATLLEQTAFQVATLRII